MFQYWDRKRECYPEETSLLEDLVNVFGLFAISILAIILIIRHNPIS